MCLKKSKIKQGIQPQEVEDLVLFMIDSILL